MLLLPPGGANHNLAYRYNPVEHDDIGRSDEPDFLTTSLFGRQVENCIAEIPVSGTFIGHCTRGISIFPGQMATVAPGCTTDGPNGPERRQSGLCGLHSVGLSAGGYFSPIPIVGLVPAATVPEPISVRGMAGDRAPGALTPTKGSTIRLFDGFLTPMVAQRGVPLRLFLEVNHKVSDASGTVGSPLSHGNLVLPGGSWLYLWYGEWKDLNGNGVIDHFTPGSAGPGVNEFAWLGSCTTFEGTRNPQAIRDGLCREDPNPNAIPPGSACADPDDPFRCAMTTIDGWFWPGSHHTWPPAVIGLPVDYPGQQIVNHFLFGCFDYPGGCDALDEDLHGDPLLGPQGSMRPDTRGMDLTGDPADSVRQWWNYGGDHTSFYGDDGLLVTSVQLYGVNCVRDAGLPSVHDIGSCTFTDVDRQFTIAPLAEQILVGSHEQPTGGLKAAARSLWLLIRDG